MVVRKLAVLATSFALVSSMSVPAFADEGEHGNWKHFHFNNYNQTNVSTYFNFEDVDDSSYGWASQAIAKLAGEGILVGIGNGSHRYFNPGGQLTRAQFAALVTRFFNLQAPSPTSQDFNDVQPGTWYFSSIEAAKDYMTQFMDPNGGYDFRPDAVMNRSEAAVTLVEILLKENAIQLVSVDQANQILGAYTDAGLIPTNLRVYVATAIQNGLMRGVSSNRFDPLGQLNRAQAAVLLYRLQTQSAILPPGSTTSNPGTSTELPPGSTTYTNNTLSAQLAGPATVTQGTTYNYTFTVYQNGTIDNGLNGSYDAYVTTNGSGGAAVTSPVTFTNGVATVPISLNSTGTQSVTVSFGQLNVSAAATVTAVSSSSTTLSAQLSGPATITHGLSYNYTFTVYKNGSVDTDLNGSYNVTVYSNNSSNTYSVSFTNGVATVPVSLNLLGTQTVTVTGPNVSTSMTVTAQ